MDTYTTWESVPDHLATKTQLGKEGLKLAPGQKRVARKTGGYGPYNLYDKRTAVPKRKLSQAQIEAARANLVKAREALRCVDCGIYGERLNHDGRCPPCQHWHWIAQESDQARRELSEWADADDWLVLDTETTGLDHTAEVIQLGIVDAYGQVLMDRLVRPLGSIDPEATAVHGLTAADLAGAPTWPEVCPEVGRLINGRYVLTYNAQFDERIIRQTCGPYGLQPPAVASWTCVMELCAAYLGDWSDRYRSFRYISLIEACSLARVNPYGEDGRYLAHDAAGDALLTWRLVQSFKQEDTAVSEVSQ